MDTKTIPNHIGIIMDGNRRWAKKRLLPTNMGHKEGADRLEDIAKYCSKIGVKYLTVFAFSTENWKRSEEEVTYLMKLLKDSIEDFDKRFAEDDVCIRHIGDINGLSPELQEGIRHIEERTKNKTGLVVNVCLNYGGRLEIENAIKRIAQEYKDGKISSLDNIDEQLIASYMYMHLSPDPDLIIRTGGELRTSGFLTWESVYSEMYFVDTLWPDFREADLDKAIEEFNNRSRRFGK